MTVWQSGVGLDDADMYVRTRRQLHGVAEILIAGPQHCLHGTIRLAVSKLGFRGAAQPIAVEGTDLVWPHGRATLADGCENYLQQFRATVHTRNIQDELDPDFRDKLLAAFHDWR